MQNETYWRSKLPVSLVLLYILNLLIVLALEILLLYPYPTAMTPDALSQFDSTYEGCTILSTAERGKLRCYLVETADGEIHLVPTNDHSIAYKRSRILKKYISIIPDGQDVTLPVKVGLHTSNVTVSKEALSNTPCITIDYYGSSTQHTTTIYMVIAAILEALELALWHILKKQ